MPDVRRGLYRHYKGNSYRVLLTARYMGKGDLIPDEVVEVFADVRDGQVELVVDRAVPRYENAMLAQNSTDGPTPDGCTLVVYVALYGDGRVSVREIGEFTADVDAELKIPRFVWADR